MLYLHRPGGSTPRGPLRTFNTWGPLTFGIKKKRWEGRAREQKGTKPKPRATGGIFVEFFKQKQNQFLVRQALHLRFTTPVGNNQVSCIIPPEILQNVKKLNYISFCLSLKERKCHSRFSEVGWKLKITNKNSRKAGESHNLYKSSTSNSPLLF